jgi:hypothetical protein
MTAPVRSPRHSESAGLLARQDSAVTFFHVTSSSNRESIDRHGLDWTLMSAARGIAGSNSPEQEGCFLCQDESEADWFACMGSSFGPVDVWAVEGVNESDLIESPEHYFYVTFPIPRGRLKLVRQDVQMSWAELHAGRARNVSDQPAGGSKRKRS